MVKKIVLSSLLVVSCLSASASDSNQTEGLKYIKILGEKLKSSLQKEMKKDKSGVAAMHFCADKADKLTKKVNKKLPVDVSVRRTSLKYRSEANKPDGIDTETMQQIQQKMDSGKKDFAKPVVVELDGRTRVYKPLFVETACIKCHGDVNATSPELASIIKEKYPTDMAIKYKEGDFRGVIVSEIIE